MSYSVIQSQPGLQDGETAVQLDSGDYIAVGVDIRRCTIEQSPTYYVTARAINPSDGSTKLDPHGAEIKTSATHKTNDTELAALTENGVIKECVLLALGEPPTLDGSGNPVIPWSQELRDSASVRRAISSAAIAGPVQDLAAIL